jgi:HSP20 family protein
MTLENLKQSLSGAWDSMAEGWRRLRDSASGALTAFRPGKADTLPAAEQVDDIHYFPAAGWGMLAGNVFEDEKNVVVHLEIPGMEKRDFDIQVERDMLTVSGEKRFERESGEGRYRRFECAYGAFHRSLPLPAPVVPEKAAASYRNGILRIVLPKQTPARPKGSRIPVN